MNAPLELLGSCGREPEILADLNIFMNNFKAIHCMPGTGAMK